jgi:hypothetical protein
MKASLPPVNDASPAGRGGRRLPCVDARAQMMRRQAGLSVQARIDLLEALSRDAAWARSAMRVR